MAFSNIGFIGLGLIGGSIAKTIKKKYPKTRMIARTSHIETVRMAYNDGIIANYDQPTYEELCKCDLLFLCSPVKINVKYLTEMKDMIPPSLLITDVGSVKGDIQKAVEELGLAAQFIGGHPMCGAEKIGYEYSTDYLIENAYYLLTNDDQIAPETVEEFGNYIKSLGSLVKHMTPEYHDFATAAISHLPHIISASLVNTVEGNDDDNDTLKTIAAGGFKDITRISSSSPVMWEHICLTNPEQILKLMDLFQDQLDAFRREISANDGDAIRSRFQNAKDYRDNLPIHKKGSIPSVYEFYCELIDEVGGIATIATMLSVNGINIRNIGIIHNREYEGGVLRIELYDDDSMSKAIEILKNHHYIIHER